MNVPTLPPFIPSHLGPTTVQFYGMIQDDAGDQCEAPTRDPDVFFWRVYLAPDEETIGLDNYHEIVAETEADFSSHFAADLYARALSMRFDAPIEEPSGLQ